MANPPDKKPPQPTRISIELPPNLEATYANFTLIGHTPSEIILDFAQLLPNAPKTKIHARIVMTPINAKLLHRALGENIAKFEAKYGEIKAPNKNIILDPKRGFTG